MIQIHGDYDEIDHEIDRIGNMPTLEMKAELALVLEFGLFSTQAEVHVETGSLKSSGKEDFETKKRRWTGTITYGGPSAGVNNPVKYAIYEQRRGGPHNFMSATDELGPLWITALKTGLSKK